MENIKSRIEAIDQNGPQDTNSLKQLFIDIIQIQEEATALSYLADLQKYVLRCSSKKQLLAEVMDSDEILSAVTKTQKNYGGT
jgi:hypothetical protein